MSAPVQAFPWCGDLNACPTIHLGMTLRDWFAGQALAGIMARMKHSDFNSCVDADDFSFVAGDSYAMANAMMVARAIPARKT